MKHERLARYTATVPITFSFKTADDVDLDKLYKLAEAYLEMSLASGMYDIGEIEVTEKETLYTKAEREEADRRWAAFIKSTER